MTVLKDTPTRILDEAEALFAEKGYKATSLGEVADRVGIRSPSLYNHFKNKEALYQAVLDRLIALFNEPLNKMLQQPVTRSSIQEWLETIVELHYTHPNLARLLQHAALAGGPHTSVIVNQMFRPLFEHRPEGPELGFFQGNDLEPWAVMAFNNIVMSYITMAPMYREMLPVDPFSEEGLMRQKQLISQLARLVFSVGDEPTGLGVGEAG
ncbi:TetR/AcrR family transcriptional regulator [Litorivivens sp.]|uniref:TetR/AcrR family transcriptional regulator n=1 Tax=Litorivivens sp. TaxID=2020868 RepID=UPI0035641A3D